MAVLDLHPAATQDRNWLKAADEALTRALDRLLDWRDRAGQRRHLLALPDAALRDFAASRADAAREGGKPFWRG